MTQRQQGEETPRRRKALAASFLFLALCSLAAWIPAQMAVSARFLERQFILYGDTGASGITPGDRSALARSLAAYLSGAEDSPQLTVFKHGGAGPALSERELSHLLDVRFLVGWGRLLPVLGMVCVLGAVLSLWRPGKAPSGAAFRDSFLCASAGLFVCAMGLSLWGAVDFDGLFASFHRLLFKNDLWQLDPAKDLLLQLMPDSFFISSAVMAAAGLMIPTTIAVLFAAVHAKRLRRKDRRDER